jgi:hypothetical protein
MKAFGEQLSAANEQLKVLNNHSGFPDFDSKYKTTGEELLVKSKFSR